MEWRSSSQTSTSCIGFDDILLASQIRPALTTIRQPLVEKGAIAAELLLGNVERKTSKVLETQLIVRDSSAPDPVNIAWKIANFLGGCHSI